MRKSWGLADKILSGEKKIESRWYLNKCKPWNRIIRGDTVYFKDSGSFVKIKSKVDHVLQFENLTPDKVSKILNTYGSRIGIDAKDKKEYFQKFKDKRYCILIFLKEVKTVTPFDINKQGFGSMSAWIIVDDIKNVLKFKLSKSPGFK